MTRTFVALLVMFATASLATAAEKFTSKDGKYSATFPSAPKEPPAQEVDSPIGKLKLFIAAAEAGKNQAFMVIYNDYPAVVAAAPPQKILEGVRDGSKGPTGKVVSDKEIKVGDKVPGRDYVLDKGGNFFRSRSVLDGTRLYQVVVVGKTQDDVTSKQADEFINSFKIEK